MKTLFSDCPHKNGSKVYITGMEIFVHLLDAQSSSHNFKNKVNHCRTFLFWSTALQHHWNAVTEKINNIDEGFPGVLWNKGTLAKYRREQGNIFSLFSGNRRTKLKKLEEENIVSKFIKRGMNTENVWEHGNMGQFRKGTKLFTQSKFTSN